jgi:hypothetical protein
MFQASQLIACSALSPTLLGHCTVAGSETTIKCKTMMKNDRMRVDIRISSAQ